MKTYLIHGSKTLDLHSGLPLDCLNFKIMTEEQILVKVNDMKNLDTTWRTEWETITKGQEFTYECDNNGETTSTVDYVVQNRYYSLVVLSNGFEYTLHSKLWLELSHN